MIECPACGRLYPDVVGAPSQVCPHCGHEVESTAPARAAPPLPRADPVGAVALAWRVARKSYLGLVLLWAPAFLVELAVAFGVEAYARSVGLLVDGTMTTGQQMQYLGVALPLYVLVFTVRLAAWTLVGARALDVALGGARLARWRALVAPSLAMGFVLTLAYAAGWLMLVVGFLVFFHWFLYAPAMLADGASGLGAAFDRSRRFARERRTMGFTALALVVGLALAVPYFLVGDLAEPWGLVAQPAWAWLVGPILPLLAASFVAVARDAPAPGARAGLAPRATTTCPQCRTLIPYTPSTGPVDVTCPSCGRAGRVL